MIARSSFDYTKEKVSIAPSSPDSSPKRKRDECESPSRFVPIKAYFDFENS